MKTRAISMTKEIGGDAVPVPMLSFESKAAAFERFDAFVESERGELDSEIMRDIGGRTELYLEKCDNIIGIGGEMLRHVTIKRPLHSPRATVTDRRTEGDGE